MPDKLGWPFAASVVAVVLAFSPNGTIAAPRHHHHRSIVVHPHHYANGWPPYAVARRWPREYGYVSPSEVPRVMPGGYVYLPGHGIVGSPCNMPDSACTNDYRTVR